MAKSVEVYGQNKDTEDSFKILFSSKINSTFTAGIERKSLVRTNSEFPYSFNNIWYMMTNHASLNQFTGKEIAVCDSPAHNIFIPTGSEIYISVQGKSRSKICNLEKIYRVEANQNLYPAAIYARNIDIAVREKFLVNQTAGRNPAVVCKDRFNLTMKDVPGMPSSVDSNIFNNLGGMPFFLQDGILYTNTDSITINGANFRRDDPTLSEKYRVRLEDFQDFMERKFPYPMSVGESLGSNVLTAIKLPKIYKKLLGASRMDEVNELLSPNYTPPLNEPDEYAILVGNGTIPAEDFEAEVTRLMIEAALLKFYTNYYAQITSNPGAFNLSPQEIATVKQKKDELEKKAYERTISFSEPTDTSIPPPETEVYALMEKGIGPNPQDLQVVRNNFGISGYTIEMEGNVNCTGDIVIRGGSYSDSGYVLSYAYSLGRGGSLSAKGAITIEGGLRGSGTMLANNIVIKGPLKLNDEQTTYTSLYAFQNLTIDYKQEALEFRTEDISPAWVVSNFMLAYFSKRIESALNTISANNSELLSPDENIINMLDNFTLADAIKIQDFPMDRDLRDRYQQKTLRKIMLEKYFYNSSSGNNSPEGFVRHLYSTFIKNNTLNKQGIYSLFNVDPRVFSQNSFVDSPIPPPSQATPIMNITPSSNIRGFLCSGKDMMININSGDFSVEGAILCGESFIERGLDNFIVRYDPSFSTLYTNPGSGDYRVSQILFGRF